jgi:hypothetical protein
MKYLYALYKIPTTSVLERIQYYVWFKSNYFKQNFNRMVSEFMTLNKCILC